MSELYNTVNQIREARGKLVGIINKNFNVLKGMTITTPYASAIHIQNDKAYIYMIVQQSFLDAKHITVTIENISLDSSIQRKGICTKLVEIMLNGMGSEIDGVLISQVLSHEMREFCKSRGFMKIDKANELYIKFRSEEAKREYFDKIWIKHLNVTVNTDGGYKYTDITPNIFKYAFRDNTQKSKQVANWLRKNKDNIKIGLVLKPYKLVYMRRLDFSDKFGKIPKYVKEYISRFASSFTMVGEMPALANIEWLDTHEKDILSSTSYYDYYTSKCIVKDNNICETRYVAEACNKYRNICSQVHRELK